MAQINRIYIMAAKKLDEIKKIDRQRFEYLGLSANLISHDLNSQIGIILMAAKYLQENQDQLKPEILDRLLGKIIKANHRIEDLSNNIRDFAEIQKSVTAKGFQFGELNAEVLDQLQRELQGIDSKYSLSTIASGIDLVQDFASKESIDPQLKIERDESSFEISLVISNKELSEEDFFNLCGLFSKDENENYRGFELTVACYLIKSMGLKYTSLPKDGKTLFLIQGNLLAKKWEKF